jgi:uncharacterized membrane protein YeaQ/YmgE (transglycosylase-associated protein family)
MMLAVWVVVGMLVGWGAGRLLALKSGGAAGDLVSGVLGSVAVAWIMQATLTGAAGGSLEAVLGGAAGALAATLAHRAYTGRYQRVSA